MKSSLILTLLFTSFTVSQRRMGRGRQAGRIYWNEDETIDTSNPYEDDESESVVLDKHFNKIRDKFSYKRGSLSFDISQENIDTIKTTIPSSSKWELVHIDLLASRWYQAKYPSKVVNHTINSLAGREIIYPVSVVNSPGVISIDIDEFADLPMTMNEDIETYAKRIQSNYKEKSKKKLRKIINNRFFKTCNGMRRSRRETGSSPYAQCGQVLIKNINTKARFTASSLSKIYFDRV